MARGTGRRGLGRAAAKETRGGLHEDLWRQLPDLPASRGVREKPQVTHRVEDEGASRDRGPSGADRAWSEPSLRHISSVVSVRLSESSVSTESGANGPAAAGEPGGPQQGRAKRRRVCLSGRPWRGR